MFRMSKIANYPQNSAIPSRVVTNRHPSSDEKAAPASLSNEGLGPKAPIGILDATLALGPSLPDAAKSEPLFEKVRDSTGCVLRPKRGSVGTYQP